MDTNHRNATEHWQHGVPGQAATRHGLDAGFGCGAVVFFWLEWVECGADWKDLVVAMDDAFSKLHHTRN